MPSIQHVRDCDPQTMVSYAAALLDANRDFTGEVRAMDRAVDDATGSWRGDAATAASARALSDRLVGSHIGVAVDAVANHHDNYGRQLALVRQTLLDILVHDARGMGVTDAGAVTPPRVAGSDTGAFAALLLQMELNAQANTLQTRITDCLTSFEALETRAALAISDSSGTLERLLRDPSGGPISPQVLAITEGVGRLPTDPALLREFWAPLTPAEKDALYHRDPTIGGRDGIPAADRDHYNRQTLADYQTQANAAHATAEALERNHPDWAAGRAPSATATDYPAYTAWKAQRDRATVRATHRGALQDTARKLEADTSPPKFLLRIDERNNSTIVDQPVAEARRGQ